LPGIRYSEADKSLNLPASKFPY